MSCIQLLLSTSCNLRVVTATTGTRVESVNTVESMLLKAPHARHFRWRRYAPAACCAPVDAPAAAPRDHVAGARAIERAMPRGRDHQRSKASSAAPLASGSISARAPAIVRLPVTAHATAIALMKWMTANHSVFRSAWSSPCRRTHHWSKSACANVLTAGSINQIKPAITKLPVSR